MKVYTYNDEAISADIYVYKPKNYWWYRTPLMIYMKNKLIHCNFRPNNDPIVFLAYEFSSRSSWSQETWAGINVD